MRVELHEHENSVEEKKKHQDATYTDEVKEQQYQFIGESFQHDSIMALI